MATSFNQVAIGGADRRDDVLKVELWRTVSAIGNWMAVLRNTDGIYNGVFDVQDQFLIDINAPAATLMQGRVDGPECVTTKGVDLQSDWDEYVVVRGVDQAQDLLFHNDFEYTYDNSTFAPAALTIDRIWDNVINTQLSGLTNITYVIPGATNTDPFEFKEGTSFLSTMQELFRKEGHIWYVDDTLAFHHSTPPVGASGVTLTSVAGNPSNNIIDVIDLTERDGDKLFDYIKFYGKNPMFDGYTEENHTGVATTGWTAAVGGIASPNIADNTTTIRVGNYSGVVWNDNPVGGHLRHILTLPVFNYVAGDWDFSKGEIGFWGYYDNTAAAPGAPAAGTEPANEYAEIRLYDNAGAMAVYSGESTRLYVGEWGWCSAPLGEKYNTVAAARDSWYIVAGAGNFNWNDVRIIWFTFDDTIAGSNSPSHFYIDGITLPIPCVSIADGVTGTITDGTGTLAVSPTALVRGLNQPTVLVAGTFTIDLPCSTTGIAASNGWVVTGSPVTLNPGTNIITVQGGGAGVIDITLDSLYRRRPYIDYYQQIRTQNALDAITEGFLEQHKCSTIGKVKITTPGNINLRYAGQSITVNVPALGLVNTVMYMTSIHHVIEPYTDVSNGYGFDWITEIEAVPTSGIGYDMARLRIGDVYSGTQRLLKAATALREK